LYLDIILSVTGGPIPIDHSYLLYAALSRVAPVFHDDRAGVRFAPVTGAMGERALLTIQNWSRFRIRLPAERIPAVLPLAGRSLSVGSHSIRLGVPTVASIVPAPAVAARIVTFKHSIDPVRFLEHARKRLHELGVNGEPGIPLVERGPRAGEPRRRIVRVKDSRVIGFALQVAGLTAEESLRLQEEGLGGRSRIGCGFFMPVRPRA
jgi:CRISPR-associated protein Cas6